MQLRKLSRRSEQDSARESENNILYKNTLGEAKGMPAQAM